MLMFFWVYQKVLSTMSENNIEESNLFEVPKFFGVSMLSTMLDYGISIEMY